MITRRLKVLNLANHGGGISNYLTFYCDPPAPSTLVTLDKDR